jgi:hypothetical protein
MWSRNPTPGDIPKGMHTGYSRGTCTSMFIVALFTIAKSWKQQRCPTSDEWIKKTWYLYTMEFYSAMKKKILSFASNWMEMENIILSMVTRLRRPKIICSPSYEDFRSRANTAMWLDFGHMIKGKHIWEVWV